MGWNGTGRHAERQGNPGLKKASRGARKRKSQPSSAHPGPEEEAGVPQPTGVRTGIVSVNGRDVGVMHCRRS
jgi:hypothetical protein